MIFSTSQKVQKVKKVYKMKMFRKPKFLLITLFAIKVWCIWQIRNYWKQWNQKNANLKPKKNEFTNSFAVKPEVISKKARIGLKLELDNIKLDKHFCIYFYPIPSLLFFTVISWTKKWINE